MGEEVHDLVQQVDAQIVVVDADVHVHAADEQPPGHGLHVAGEHVVALLVGVDLFLPLGKGMGGGGDGGEPMLAGHVGDGSPEPGQVVAGLAFLEHGEGRLGNAHGRIP